MTHLHEMHDTDTHFKIDPITRQIINKSEKTKLVQGDHNSEIYTFDIPAIIEGHKMIDCNRIEVHYTNKPRRGTEISEDVYLVTDAKTVDYNLVFSWEIGRNATKYAGGLSFVIKFLCIEEDGRITYEWNTETFDGIEVAAGKNNTEQIVEEKYDILEKFGKVKTVNGQEPDENGNVDIEIEIPEAEGKVKTVNGQEPDENGNITIEFPEVEIPDCVVQTVNGVGPDENGNIEIEFPEIDIPECAVQTVNGKAPDENGNIEIDIPTGGGGEATWESLPDKPFGEITSIGEIVSETAKTISSSGTQLSTEGVIEVDKNYTVTWDNVVYECTAYAVEVQAGTGVFANILGNAELFGLAGGNDEPFMLVYNESAGAIIAVGDGEEHTVKVEGEITTLKKISSEFMPDEVSLFKIANITYDASNKIWSADMTSNEIRKALTDGYFVFAKYSAAGVPFFLPFTSMSSDGRITFAGFTYENSMRHITQLTFYGEEITCTYDTISTIKTTGLKGVYFKASNGKQYRLDVDESGALTAEEITY